MFQGGSLVGRSHVVTPPFLTQILEFPLVAAVVGVFFPVSWQGKEHEKVCTDGSYQRTGNSVFHFLSYSIRNLSSRAVVGNF